MTANEMKRLCDALDLLHVPHAVQLYIIRYVVSADCLPDLERNLEDIKKEDPNT